MKEIKAIIQPFLLSKVVDALRQIEDLPGVTVSEVRGFGRGHGRSASVGIVDEGVEFAIKTKLEIVVPDHLVEDVLRAVSEHAHTGRPGDGKIFVATVDEVVNVRTSERGEAAI